MEHAGWSMQGVNPMLTERLKAAIVIAGQLPPEAQERVAAHLESAIANVVWDTDLNDPTNDEWLAEWIAEARRDDMVGFPYPGLRRADNAK